MPNSNLFFNRGTTYGIMLGNVIGNLEAVFNGLNGLIGTMQLMINGDGSTDVMYAEITTRFGFVSDLASHTAFNELISLQSKLNVDTSVTLVKTEILQAINKFR